MESPNQRLQRARERSRLSPGDLTTEAGLPSVACYYDLEDVPQELYMTVSLAEIGSLCGSLGITPRYLFTGEEDGGRAGGWDLGRLADRLTSYLRTAGLTQEQFEERAGWDLGRFVDDPARAVGEWNIDCLRDVCRELGEDWTRFLPG